MKDRPVVPTLFAAVALAALAACNSQPKGVPVPLQDVPGMGGAAQPGMGGQPAAGGIAAPAQDAGTGAMALNWTAPEGWVSVPPSSSMRRAQYKVPGPAGDAELVVFYFGPGQGGPAEANAQRWAGQFENPDGTPATNTLKTAERKFGEIDVLMVEANGVYQSGTPGMGPKTPIPGYKLLGAVAKGPDANWFFKLIGPAASIEANRAAFDTLLASLKSGS